MLNAKSCLDACCIQTSYPISLQFTYFRFVLRFYFQIECLHIETRSFFGVFRWSSNTIMKWILQSGDESPDNELENESRVLFTACQFG